MKTLKRILTNTVELTLAVALIPAAVVTGFLCSGNPAVESFLAAWQMSFKFWK